MGTFNNPNRRTVLSKIPAVASVGLAASSQGQLVDETDNTTDGVKITTALSGGEPYIQRVVPEEWYNHMVKMQSAYEELKARYGAVENVKSLGIRRSEERISRKQKFELVAYSEPTSEPSAMNVPAKINNIPIHKERRMEEQKLAVCGDKKFDAPVPGGLPSGGPRIENENGGRGTAGFYATKEASDGATYEVIISAYHVFETDGDGNCIQDADTAFHHGQRIGQTHWKSEIDDWIAIILDSTDGEDDINDLDESVYDYESGTRHPSCSYYSSYGINNLISDGTKLSKEGMQTGHRDVKAYQKVTVGIDCTGSKEWVEFNRHYDESDYVIAVPGDSGGIIYNERSDGEAVLVSLTNAAHTYYRHVCDERGYRYVSGPPVHRIASDGGFNVGC